MIKSTAAVLGLLFLISCSYYLAFWGSFDIDIFQYIQISDIIKGVAYPLRIPGVWLLIAAGETAVALSIVLLERDEKDFQANVPIEQKLQDRWDVGNRIYFIARYILLAAAFAGICHYATLANSPVEIAMITGLISTPLIAAASVASYATVEYQFETRKIADLLARNKRPKLKNGLKKLLNYVIVACSVYFIVNALSLGLLDARKINEDKEYNYVTDTSFLGLESLGNKQQLIYLGAVSDKFLFTYKNNKKHFVVDKNKIPVLAVCHHASSESKNIVNITFVGIINFLYLLYDLFVLVIILYLVFKRKWLIAVFKQK